MDKNTIQQKALSIGGDEGIEKFDPYKAKKGGHNGVSLEDERLYGAQSENSDVNDSYYGRSNGKVKIGWVLAAIFGLVGVIICIYALTQLF